MTSEQAMVPVEPIRATVFGTDNPAAIVQRVADVATPLGRFIKERHMSTQISGREYVLGEGWAFMGSMLGVFPRPVRVAALRDDEGRVYGYEAHIELVTAAGAVVGGGIAECSRYEKHWSERDDFALKSMAQTRAVGKAYRLSFGYVMKAAGYEATPAEEMDGIGHVEPRTTNGRSAAPAAKPIGAPVVHNRGGFLTWAKAELGMKPEQTLATCQVEAVGALDGLAEGLGGWADLQDWMRDQVAAKA